MSLRFGKGNSGPAHGSGGGGGTTAALPGAVH